MATNLRASGQVFDYIAGATITSSSPVLIGDRLGVALIDGVSGDTIPVQVEGVFTIAKRTGSGSAITQGSKVYWDAGNSRIDNTDNSAANKHIGYAYKAATTADTTVDVDLIG
jgi:predicted RecA/RadA family phage recombinase